MLFTLLRLSGTHREMAILYPTAHLSPLASMEKGSEEEAWWLSRRRIGGKEGERREKRDFSVEKFGLGVRVFEMC